jgi:hypothetical protein
MENHMGSRNRRMLAAIALVFAMSAIVGLVVLSPLVWRDGSSPGPAPEALPAQGEVAEIVVPEPEPEETAKTPPSRAGHARPQQASRGDACVAREVAAPAGQDRPLQRSPAATSPPAVVDKKGKAKGHEKKELGSKKAGKHGHHAQGAPGKGHGKGKSKDRDRAPARARG